MKFKCFFHSTTLKTISAGADEIKALSDFVWEETSIKVVTGEKGIKVDSPSTLYTRPD